MKLRTLVVAISAVAGLSMAPAAFSQTCATSAWGQGGNPTVGAVVGAPVAGGPLAATPVARYSGRCGLRAPTGAGNYVQDSSPAAEPTFRARFYAFLPASGTSTIFRAGNATADSALTTFTDGRIRVEWNGSNSIVARGPGGTPTLTCSGLTAGRWYSVELAYNSTGSALGTGADLLAANSMRLNVQNETATPAINCTQTNTGIATAANNTIDYVQLGNLTGGTAGNAITVDSYESRRTTPIGRLCRGNADASNNSRDVNDMLALRNEILNPTAVASLAGGQPDCNEDGGRPDVNDMLCVRGIVLAGAAVAACPAL
jgi:hypothetical protein